MLSIPERCERLRLKNWQKCQLMSKEHPSLKNLSHLVTNGISMYLSMMTRTLPKKVFFLSPRMNSKFEKTHTCTIRLYGFLENLDHLDISWKKPKPSHLDSTNFPSRFQVVAAFQVKPGGDASELHAAVRGLRSF